MIMLYVVIGLVLWEIAMLIGVFAGTPDDWIVGIVIGFLFAVLWPIIIPLLILLIVARIIWGVVK